MRTELEGGKYVLEFSEGSGALLAYRYGELWENYTGSKFMYLLLVRIKELECALKDTQEELSISRWGRWPS